MTVTIQFEYKKTNLDDRIPFKAYTRFPDNQGGVEYMASFGASWDEAERKLIILLKDRFAHETVPDPKEVTL